MNDLQMAASVEERQAALDAVLRSATFIRNPRLGELLRYLCRKSFAGEAGSLKEYTIATDVFERPEDFDQSTDAIVRVEMHRLRKKLKEFYASEGEDQKFEIVIHSGNYAPEFLERRVTAPGLLDPRWASVTQETLAKNAKTPLRAPNRPLKRWLPVAIGLALGLLFVLFFVNRNRFRTSEEAFSAHLTVTSAIPAGANAEIVRILCGRQGGRVTDHLGNEWGADRFFSGGSEQENANVPIYRTRNSVLFHTSRTGDFSYSIPLKPKVYELHLYFADTAYTPGISMEGGENTRFFNVVMNGHILLRNFDVIASAGPNTAYERVFKDVQPDKDGYLHLNFTREVGVPFLNAIEILPAAPHRTRPVRISTQDGGFTDKSGVYWQPDDYFLNGRSIAKYGIVAGRADSQIFARERYGNFSYAIPAAQDSTYQLNLYFAETFFGADEQGGGGAGNRVFDVYCNGVALIRRLDVYREAGSAHQLTKTFHDIEPNAQGNVLISFVPRENYAMVSAIELIDETPQ